MKRDNRISIGKFVNTVNRTDYAGKTLHFFETKFSFLIFPEPNGCRQSDIRVVFSVSTAIPFCRRSTYVFEIVSAREFITRALLSSKTELSDVVSILTNDGAGTADGFNVNFSFLDMPQEMRVFYTAEVIPCEDETKSIVSVNSFGSGQNSLHTNRSVCAPREQCSKNVTIVVCEKPKSKTTFLRRG